MSDDVYSIRFFLEDNDGKTEVHRAATIHSDHLKDFNQLQSFVKNNVLTEAKERNFAIRYLDSDGHFVTISNDDNFQLALKSATDGPLHPLKLYIKLQGSVYGMNDELASCKGAVHDGVLCDECDGAIMGFRYKCIECPDFDLCGQCESGAVHAAHVMLRVSESTAVHVSNPDGREDFVTSAVLRTLKRLGER